MSNRRLLGERVAVRVSGCPTRDGVLISGVKKQTKLIQRFHVRFPNGDVRTHRGDQILLRGSKAPLTEFVRVGDIIFTKNTLGVVRFVGKHEEFPDLVIVMEPMDPKLPTDPNVESFRKLFPSANLSDKNPYNILTKAEDILKMLPPDSLLKQISNIKDKYLAFIDERKVKEKQFADNVENADCRIQQLVDILSQLREKIEAIEAGGEITHVNDEPYTEKILDAHTAGVDPYTLTFEVPNKPVRPLNIDFNAGARPGLSDDVKEVYELQIKKLRSEIAQSQKLVMSLEAKNTQMEEVHQEMTGLRVKVEQLRNSRMMFMSQIKNIQNRGKMWRQKAVEFEKKYQKLLEDREQVEVKNDDPPRTTPGLSSQGQKNVEQDKKLVEGPGPAGGGSSKPRKSNRMPKPELGNTLSLVDLPAKKSKKKRKRPSWFQKGQQ